jgi:hypothetical protein
MKNVQRYEKLTKILVWKTKGKRPLRRATLRWKDECYENRVRDFGWTLLAQDKVHV